ncbi:hypothetical protein LK540_22425 [Massilia sp. IC2-278]|uniref:hypothetical protein n=1 Tax=Massilia sp. IC2-278 TaxID=2887200 RepID=UPI001E33B05E|nr:hypothetical protein [Massilia sp. IC2-278]MCC2963195.1 hypothetical protein [Massilia sp. IC2-278]
MELNQKLYHAIIWEAGPDVPGKRVAVAAYSLEDARQKLEAQFGKGTVFNLHNEFDADAVR